MSNLLVVDDAVGFVAIQRILQPEGFQLHHTQGFASASRLCREGRFDLALIDLCLGADDTARSGLDLLREAPPRFPAIVLSDASRAEQLEESLQVGARDYFFKPVTQRLVPVIRSALATAGRSRPLQRLVGSSPVMRQLRERIRAVAAHDVRVLIVGPSGSGKELVARAIHELSPRRAGPLICVNCAAFPRDLIESELFGYERGAFTGAINRHRGLFELAHQGTIFLDEIEDLAPRAQAKLLRVIEEMRFRRVGGEEEVAVDVRVIAASNQDLHSRIGEGQFREDLFHRISVVMLRVPPLSEHLEDVPELVAHFLRELGSDSFRVSPAATEQLLDYGWPGNVRELRNTIERTLVFASGSEVSRFNLPATEKTAETVHAEPCVGAAVEQLSAAFGHAVRAGKAPRDILATIERTLVETALTLARGNKTAAARWLDIDRKSLVRRLHREESPGSTEESGAGTTPAEQG